MTIGQVYSTVVILMVFVASSLDRGCKHSWSVVDDFLCSLAVFEKTGGTNNQDSSIFVAERFVPVTHVLAFSRSESTLKTVAL